MQTFNVESVRDFVSGLLESYGTSEEDAAVVTSSLVEANLAGHDSHGILMLPTYIERIKNGRIKPGADIKLVRESPVIAYVDGGWNFGQIIARKAMELAIEKASREGVALVCSKNTNHVGRLGQYTLMAAEKGLIGIMMVNSGPAVAPWPGIKKKLGTNPISIAFPRKTGKPFLLDMATSVVAGGKVLLSETAGERIPEGWIIDKSGNPSTDPKDFHEGALLSLGTYKGYGLAFMIDILCGAFTGAGTSNKISGTNGVFILAAKQDLFVSKEDVTSLAEGLASYVLQTPLRNGYSEMMLPGDLEIRNSESRLKNGIYIDEHLLAKLNELALEKGEASLRP